MDKRYLVNYQNTDRGDFTIEAYSREEADEIALELQEEGFINIIIDEIRV